MACGRHGHQIIFNFSKEAHDTIKDIADGAIPLMPSISLDDFGLSVEGMSKTAAIIVTAAVVGPLLIVALNITCRAFKFYTMPRRVASSMVLESLNSNIINTPLRRSLSARMSLTPRS